MTNTDALLAALGRLGMLRDGSEERERDLDCEIRRLRREVEIARKRAERDRLLDELDALRRGRTWR